MPYHAWRLPGNSAPARRTVGDAAATLWRRTPYNCSTATGNGSGLASLSNSRNTHAPDGHQWFAVFTGFASTAPPGNIWQTTLCISFLRCVVWRARNMLGSNYVSNLVRKIFMMRHALDARMQHHIPGVGHRALGEFVANAGGERPGGQTQTPARQRPVSRRVLGVCRGRLDYFHSWFQRQQHGGGVRAAAAGPPPIGMRLCRRIEAPSGSAAGGLQGARAAHGQIAVGRHAGNGLSARCRHRRAPPTRRCPSGR